MKEAKALFRKTAADPAAEAKSRGEAKLALSHLLLLSGGKKEAAEALAILAQLEKNEKFSAEARLTRIYALIRAGRPKEARKLAENSSFDAPRLRRRLTLLRLLALVHTGAADEFDAEWKKARNDIAPRPDRLALDTLDQAARQAVKGSHPERAAFYLNDAYGFADRDEVRRDVLRKLFNCCAAFDARQAAAAARRYAEVFPDPGDGGEASAERAEILIEAGRLLCAAGDHKAAMEFFKTVAADSKAPSAKRHAAAGDAALASETLNDHESAKRYFESHISTAQTPEELQSSQVFYAEYLIRRGDFAGAEKLLRGISEPADRKLKDRVGWLLVQSLSAQDKFAPALIEADLLRRSPDPKNAGFGEFYAALMTDKLGRGKEARERYFGYVGRFPDGEFVRAAKFSAAKLAEETGDHAAAAKEFFAYSEAFADDPNAGSALFWALRNGGLAGDLEIASKSFEALKRVAGVGPEYYAAALQLADFMSRKGGSAEALALLEAVDRSKCGGAEAAMLDLMRVRLLVACRRRDEAIAAAEQLLAEHPAESAAADAAFLAGDLYLARENPNKALELLQRAHQLRPSGAFGDVVAARLADCRLELYKSGGAQQDLDAAAAEFERLADSAATDPHIRLMCRYKLGWCREKQGDPRAAVESWYQALLYAAELKRAGRIFDAKWCSRSAYSALNLLLTLPWPDADQRGAAILDAVKQLELPGGDAEFETVRREFNERYLNREI
jgi:tetratricopeptide (TPR) repeat protein